MVKMEGGEFVGFYLRGYYVGCETRDFRNQDGSITRRSSINLATGNLAYRVYLSDDFDLADLDGLRIGDELTISCRVYVSQRGTLQVVDGKIAEF